MIADPDAQRAAEAGDHVMMLMTDPPLHTRMRRLVSRDFTPRAALLREILTRLPNLEQAGEAKWMQSNFILGPTTLP